MRKVLVATLAGVALVISGCGGDSEPTPRETVYVQEDENSGFSEKEEEFLFDVATFMTPALDKEPQEDVVTLGYSICKAFDNGASLAQVVNVGIENGLTEKDTIVIAAAASVNFCPEHEVDTSGTT